MTIKPVALEQTGWADAQAEWACSTCGKPALILEFVTDEGRAPSQHEQTLFFNALCRDCALEKSDAPAYDIPAAECRTVVQLRDWLQHLEEKGWFRSEERANWLLRTWMASVPRRPRARAYLIASIRAAVMERDGFRCQRCGCGSDDEMLVIDHIVPHIHGGALDARNLQTLCETCNLGKGARAPTVHDLGLKNFGGRVELP